MIIEKTCTRCHLTKAGGEFGKHTRSSDGLQCWCKACKRDHYEANKTAILASQNQYRTANREKVLAGKRRAYHADVEASRELRRQYRAENAEALSARAKIRYGEGGRPADMPWPDRATIAYSTAHQRVRATYGAAKNHPCSECGAPAHAWSYDHSDPNPLFHTGVGLWEGKKPVPYSPDPQRYDPLCRSCHVKRDRYGVAA
ncbi:Uncharacterised protein [Mycobacteroides abscessus subsp. abscessus]|nr:Uncharacterised protein [Mycobacteroides abscessus subsp. abscessus]SIM75016.1 Uncharacterised protein [Mycobacteroides abscessus subsp. abscessus]SKR78089.1 Uncharacterised protein [Mycobacteroides abscessus subsp. abscessus]SLE22627.1 Uncharacterised protein [Mycobacteroides abscessus subsp. abscessus]